jgi:hypothetical protein
MSYQNQSDSDHLSKIIELQLEIGGFHQGHERLLGFTLKELTLTLMNVKNSQFNRRVI